MCEGDESSVASLGLEGVIGFDADDLFGPVDLSPSQVRVLVASQATTIPGCSEVKKGEPHVGLLRIGGVTVIPLGGRILRDHHA